MRRPAAVVDTGVLVSAFAFGGVRSLPTFFFTPADPIAQAEQMPPVRNVALTAGDRLYGAAARGVFGLLWLSARALGVSPEELRCRAGEMPEVAGPLWWFHGASAGEMAAATRLTAVLRQHGYTFTAGYTATNRAGVELVSRIAAPHTVTALAPWDHPRWVARAFDRWRPAALFLIETELWPQLILEACRRSVPVFCVSARIYPRDLARYRFIRRFMAPVLRRLTVVVAQNETERERFVMLGAVPDRCVVGGNLKYLAMDATGTDDDRLRAELALRPEHQIVVFGSAHADEIGLLFDALEPVRAETVRTIIAPRHHSSVAVIERESRRRNWRLHRRTDGSAPRDWQVLVLDRMGELSRAYGLASIAVVGGGFARHGGHNPIEPVIAGTPVIFGTHFDHFEEEARALAAVTPTAQVAGATELGVRLAEWLASEPCRRDILERQRQVLPDGAAIAARYVAAIAPWLTAVAPAR